MNLYTQRICNVRALMRENKLDIYLVLHSDPHLSEYVSDFYKARTFLSGFDGSAGTLIITQEEALLFTDGRYWLEAEEALSGSCIRLEKQNAKNTFLTWLEARKNVNQKLGVDFAVLSLALKEDLEQFCVPKHYDFVSLLWHKRPSLPQAQIYEHENDFVSYSRKEKLALVRKKMKEFAVKYHLLSSLDDIAWISNLRGDDISFNPVFLSHLLLSQSQAVLFFEKVKIKPDLQKKLKADGIVLKPYNAIIKELQKLQKTTILLEPSKVSALLVEQLQQTVSLVKKTNPSTLFKACKTQKELIHIQNAMKEDGKALCEFFAFLEEIVKQGKEISEVEIDEKLQEFRAKSPFYHSESFAAIVGFNANAAIVHYRARKENCAKLTKKGLLLIDSGGQYYNGTTDITRVIPIGKPNSEQKRDYTLVLKAHIALCSAVFPKDIPLSLLDCLTRAPLWEVGLDYMHGTGHGVGYFLNVHEGPQSISYFSNNLEKSRAQVGMITSIEPGIYRKGKWGIRLENLAVICEAKHIKERDFGTFFCFKTLTLCPFELSCIDSNLLNAKEKKWLNAYHKEVFEKLSKELSPKALKWLQIRTKKL
ncbi:aminopeptidase P family protein [Campylobacter sp. MIT 21-1685]|uniref:aminopeptidase P family protein n=1 Tax=unclassified Campylobacter TaxID=2593542 RepID=UPI00224AF80B|nr:MULTISPECIES: aminopeptidase P family protein [unclassified Campylobacter]MCX2683168.1 aminopeptidase P family protein [Campylobacter sp. MIT 21-1684]MCX2751373.1 aminopeptidase P family protein [Campylobacter sp. MIT 21-1682]MCX2807572.1 aminopeptidase P family protein [Campylobacter sp. MIT 21-1685]